MDFEDYVPVSVCYEKSMKAIGILVVFLSVHFKVPDLEYGNNFVVMNENIKINFIKKMFWNNILIDNTY